MENNQSTILVVEDDATLRDEIVQALSNSGYTVLSAGSRKSALNIYERHREEISLTITDLYMLEGIFSGIDVIRGLRPEELVSKMGGLARSFLHARNIHLIERFREMRNEDAEVKIIIFSKYRKAIQDIEKILEEAASDNSTYSDELMELKQKVGNELIKVTRLLKRADFTSDDIISKFPIHDNMERLLRRVKKTLQGGSS